MKLTRALGYVLGGLSLSAMLVGGCTSQGLDSEEMAHGENVAQITTERRWVLESDGLTEGAATLAVRFTLPASYERASVRAGTGPAQTAWRGDDGVFTAAVAVAGLEPGEHAVVVSSVTSGKTLGAAPFLVSAPLYVVVSTDWDDTRMSDQYLARIEALRERHPGLRITQFFAPFHYTDPALSSARKLQIDAWIEEQRDVHGDELGVHIHGWCHFVETTLVPCRTTETFYKDDGSGYTTILAAYSEAEMTSLLDASVETFRQHGLGTPTSFRAGGWTADVGTLRALVAAGFTVDSSAVPAERWLASWKGFELYRWTSEHWQGISETSQPYFPLAAHVVEADPHRGLPILEVPDNGVLVDYVTGDDMRMIYDLNHPEGGVLEKPTLYQVGFHPPNFSDAYLERMDRALSHVDEHSFERDLGPAVYVNISYLTKVWPR